MCGYHSNEEQLVIVISGKAKMFFKAALGKDFESKNLNHTSYISFVF